MNNEFVQLIQRLNNEYIPRYLGTSSECERVEPPSSVIPIWDNNNATKYGLEYYDLMILNLMLHHNYNVSCKFTANIAELTTRLAYEGLRRLSIFDDATAKQFCNDIALNRLPNRMQFYQYLNYIQRYEATAMPIWFYYTLLLWAFIDTPKFNHVQYRSRFYTGIIHNFLSVKFVSYESDRTLDIFSIKTPIQRLVHLCTIDERYEDDDQQYQTYVIDSLRIFSVIVLATLCSRSLNWDKLKYVGGEVVTQRLLEHQSVVDKVYNTQITKGA